MTNLKQLNAQYLGYLVKYPLLTKAITAGCLAGLNETIASIITSEFNESKVCGVRIKHVFSQKLVKMMFYGGLISTPLSHYMYHIINNKIFKGKLSKLGKILQILTSLFTVTPTITCVFVSWISIINNYKISEGSFDLCQEIKKIGTVVKNGLKGGYKPTLKTALGTSFCSLVIAQNFIAPELWVVFFNIVYFFLGTYQNTKLKTLQKKLRLQKLKEQSEEEEKKQE
ncbi:uncharacterized protein J8A68_004942 [[Candida] subhashii]|uniref:Peroxisomal membrane protein PMP22 n=1 Tax=[Candida] subhashii TaxID=561895 RepID=A0A8J5QGH8_9ASCO|nr:uncharacterized protein J8A68_004942 [[Candida] subhashii]KAG7661573.1 hypothetical protein J8A68_004942 [[Candida] subhashii]